ncbi:MAG TPA: peptide-methionine (S)-S-oxide reductase MsrA [Polyangiaceae bacterium]
MPNASHSRRLICTALGLGLALVACSKGSPKSTGPTPAPPSGSSQVERRAVAVLAGGCFWGMEEILREVPGVLQTDVGYTGGSVERPSYEDVSSGRSGHAEAVRVVYDESVLSYRQLLANWFFRMHDPTTRNRQGNDVGTQYRSAIFVTTPSQRQVAESVIRELDKSGKFGAPIVTSVEEAGTFTPAEAYHQDYLQKNPGGYTCHYLRDWT